MDLEQREKPGQCGTGSGTGVGGGSKLLGSEILRSHRSLDLL